MFSYLNPLNAEFVNDLEETYLKTPLKVEPTWRSFFDGYFLKNKETGLSEDILQFEIKVIELIQGYRELGYIGADVDPLDRGYKDAPLLSLKHFHLSEADLERTSHSGHLLGLGSVSLKTIISYLKEHYCSAASIEMGHIEDPKARNWILEKIESGFLFKPFSKDEKKLVFQKLAEADLFESFIHKRFIGQKRFSAEGCDSILPMLYFLVEKASSFGANEIILGMAHRGRLNVLANVFHKDINHIFAEFTGNINAEAGDGDVKYHLGFSKNVETKSGTVHLSMLPNPSHLEAINSVLLGVTRSKQDLKADSSRKKTIPVLIHGDASFAGQGSVYEVLNMSELEGYTVGGTIHIIINNKIGFTTNPVDSRSTPNATDVAKMLEVPIFRVNADEPEAAIRCIEMALEYRNEFKRDVVIDLIGYRRYGHNEGDEPSFTQPLLYKKIQAHPNVRKIYQQKLILTKITDEQETENILETYSDTLEKAYIKAKETRVASVMASFGDRWQGLLPPVDNLLFQPVNTGISISHLTQQAQFLLSEPASFALHPKLKKNLEEKRKTFSQKKLIDWALAEHLAYSTLLSENTHIRLAGQDSKRGTFSHRHCVYFDVETGKEFVPLNHLPGSQASFEVINTLLSEFAAMGFELGQSMGNPRKLIIWEAQFGDFANGAQVIIDQFLTSSASKWQRYSGLVLYLPHGYEGQGPEHSSARLERYLQAAAKKNMQVANVTTPSQLFHLLRRQMHRQFRIPLVLMTPKSLLRHPKVVSNLDELTEVFTFLEILDDTLLANKEKVTRCVLCSGKIYYELLEEREKSKIENVALIRIEQFYPLNKQMLFQILDSYTNSRECYWVQEEPRNMGGWTFMLQNFWDEKRDLRYIGRPTQASPADGFHHIHQMEQKRIIKEGLGL